jgi:hypothetical protein
VEIQDAVKRLGANQAVINSLSGLEAAVGATAFALGARGPYESTKPRSSWPSS